MPFLEKEFPHLVESYRRRFGEQAFLSAVYKKRLSQLMARLREKHGIGNRGEQRQAETISSMMSNMQLSLF